MKIRHVTGMVGPAIAAFVIAAVVIAGCLGAPVATASATTGKSTIVLCASSSVRKGQLHHMKITVQRRVRHGFFFKQALVTAAGSCITVALPHSLSWINWLAQDISGEGHFGIGQAYPDPKSPLLAGEDVRYKNDPVTSENSKLPAVNVDLGRPAFIGYSAKLVRRGGYIYVGVRLTQPKGSRTLCRFTKRVKGGLAVVVLDRQVITDEEVSVQICGGRLLTGFPKTKSLDKPLGPRELLADLRSGPALALPLTYTLQS